MGLRGPAPTPTRLALIKGSKDAKYQARREPQPDVLRDTPGVPSHISTNAEAAEYWEIKAAQLVRDGLLTDADLVTLAMAAEQYALKQRAWKAIQPPVLDEDGKRIGGGLGDFIRDGDRQIPNPYRKQYDSARAALLQLEIQFGGTPSARARIQLPGKAKTKSKWDDLGKPQAVAAQATSA